MSHSTLDCVALEKDLPEFGLRAGDVGTVVHVLENDFLEVEFVRRDGRTHAVVTLSAAAVSPTPGSR